MLSVFRMQYVATVIYMLQSNEYQIKPYLKWYWQTRDFSKISKRGSLKRTRRAKLLLYALQAWILLGYAGGLLLLATAISRGSIVGFLVGVLAIIITPIAGAQLIVIPLLLARWFIAKPKEQRLVRQAKQRFLDTNAIKIAVAGSYGKTTVKELLLTVLSEGKKVAATPANKNVAVSHAAFAKRLAGDEDVIIIEYGEGRPGDVAGFAETTQPNIGIITGLAPAHLDQYKTLRAAGEDIFSLADYLGDKNVYVNEEGKEIDQFIKPEHKSYNQNGTREWRVSDVSVSVEGMDFTLQSKGEKLSLHTKLVGRHLLGALTVCVAIAKQLGLSNEQIVEGVRKTQPFEHRMQPYPLAGGWVIDDTYNGNIEGMRAGLQLLKDLDAPKKTYVTPGLVDQGEETKKVHHELGVLIAKASPDRVVLMKNSVTNIIKDGLTEAGYSGDVSVQNDPLAFYTNLDHFITGGEIILMQNDWPDNYN